MGIQNRFLDFPDTQADKQEPALAGTEATAPGSMVNALPWKAGLGRFRRAPLLSGLEFLFLALIWISPSAEADLVFRSGDRRHLGVVLPLTPLGAGNLTTHPRGARLLPFTRHPALSVATYAVQVYSTAAQERLVLNERGLVVVVLNAGPGPKPSLTAAQSTTAFQLARWMASRYPDAREARNAVLEAPLVDNPADLRLRIFVCDAEGETLLFDTSPNGRLFLAAENLVAAGDLPTNFSAAGDAIEAGYAQIQRAYASLRVTLSNWRNEYARLSAEYSAASASFVYFQSVGAQLRQALAGLESDLVKLAGYFNYLYTEMNRYGALRDQAYATARAYFGAADQQAARAGEANTYFVFFLAVQNWQLAAFWLQQRDARQASAAQARDAAYAYVALGGRLEAVRASLENSAIPAANQYLQAIYQRRAEVYGGISTADWYQSYYSQRMGALANYGIAVAQQIRALEQATTSVKESEAYANYTSAVVASVPLETWGLFLARSRDANVATGVVQMLVANPRLASSVAFVVDVDRVALQLLKGDVATTAPRPPVALLTTLFQGELPPVFLELATATNFPAPAL